MNIFFGEEKNELISIINKSIIINFAAYYYSIDYYTDEEENPIYQIPDIYLR